ncbi:MAG: DoxX family protein [Bacteroidia bacterium]|nr:DoxX family protein [Bacteroidia bacterium]
MLQKILSTTDNLSGLLLRLGLGIVILPHGYQKITDFGNLIDILGQHYGLPAFIAVLVILIEFFGSLLLILGVFTRINAALLGIVLFGASFYHLEHGFFMNWFGNQSGEGIQFSLLFVFSALALVFVGGGKLSIDGVLQRKIGN